MIMLEIKGVKKSYGEFQLDCSLNVEKGRITGLVGENGAGKSTLFKAVLGLISYDAGEIKILGKIPEELSEKEKEELGVVLAETGFSGYLKGKDVEAVLAKLYPKFEAEKFHQMCEEYQIPLNKFIKEYSTGMKAKLNLIIALTHQAEFLMLDEPTAGLDPKGRDDILDQIAELHKVRGITIVLVSHSMEDMARYVDRIMVMNDGVKMFDDTPKEVFRHYKELEAIGLAAPQIGIMQRLAVVDASEKRGQAVRMGRPAWGRRDEGGGFAGARERFVGVRAACVGAPAGFGAGAASLAGGSACLDGACRSFVGESAS